MNTKTRVCIYATVHLPDGSLDLRTSWFDYTTPLGRKRALKRHFRYLEAVVSRQMPEWTEIEWRVTEDPKWIPSHIRYAA